MFFGSNIKILRKRRRLSQEHVAEQLGVKRTSLSGYENGSVQPPFEVLIKVSEYFIISNVLFGIPYTFEKQLTAENIYFVRIQVFIIMGIIIA